MIKYKMKNYIFHIFLLLALINSNLLATDIQETIVENKNLPKPYFYRLDHSEASLPSIYILGSDHIIPASVLPEFIHETFSKCPIFINEILSPDNAKYEYLESMKQLGYEYNVDKILTNIIKSPLPSVDKIAQHILDDNAQSPNPVNSEDLPQLLLNAIKNNYSKGWTYDLKRTDLLNEFAKKHNLTLDMLNSVHPVVIKGMVENERLSSLEKDGMDAYFYNNAKIMRKEVIGLENADDRRKLIGKEGIDFWVNNMNLSLVLDCIDMELQTAFPQTESEKCF